MKELCRAKCQCREVRERDRVMFQPQAAPPERGLSSALTSAHCSNDIHSHPLPPSRATGPTAWKSTGPARHCFGRTPNASSPAPPDAPHNTSTPNANTRPDEPSPPPPGATMTSRPPRSEAREPTTTSPRSSTPPSTSIKAPRPLRRHGPRASNRRARKPQTRPRAA